MTDKPPREYLPDVPWDLQDLLYEGRKFKAIKLVRKQLGYGLKEAILHAAAIEERMREQFPAAMPASAQSGPDTPAGRRQRSLLVWGFIIMFLPIGMIFSFFGMRGLTRAQASTGWPSASGKVIKSSVEREESSYQAEILYEFTVSGTTYNGNRVAYGDYGSNRPTHARRIVNRYPKGKKVTVYYQPDDPGECLLEPGLKLQAFLMPAMGLISLLVGGVAAGIAVSNAWKRRRPEQGTEPAGQTRNPAAWTPR